MKPNSIWIFICLAPLIHVCHGADSKFENFQSLARKQRANLTLLAYATTSAMATEQGEEAIQTAESKVAKIVSTPEEKRTFRNTFSALDDVYGRLGNVKAALSTISETGASKELRDAARAADLKVTQWRVGLGYREDVHRALKSVAESGAHLNAEEARQVMLVKRDYRRAGMDLPTPERAELEKLNKELASLGSEFEENINEARGPVDFTAEDLEGLPESFLNSPGVKQPDGRYRVMANITLHARAIAENAKRPETRRKVNETRGRLAREKNIPVLKKLVALRSEIARRLGYKNWADFQTETRMAKTGASALAFEQDLSARLEPKFQAEMATLRKLKAEDTGEADAEIKIWDVDYYTNKLLKDRFAVDTEALRAFFPYQQTVDGMMAIYQRIFGLKFTQVDPPYAWAPGVQLYVAQDSASGRVMGAFYLDMFPREGKFNHFACFPQKLGKQLEDGSYDLPVCALICNFPPPSADKPSLLKHLETVTLFHEFGHVMHAILSRSRFVTQTGFAVPRDFVEAPSKMLENWVWQTEALDTFARDYRDPNRRIPAATVEAMEKARLATEGVSMRRQLSLGLTDLAFHGASVAESKDMDVVAVSNEISKRVYLPEAPDTAYIARVGHMVGYDAGYYGYQWARSLSLDMASVFQKAPKRFLDEKAGHRLRQEIYGVGFTREVNESVEKFLGRKSAPDAFLEYLGVKAVPSPSGK